jgi:Zn-dependent metalloprotease
VPSEFLSDEWMAEAKAIRQKYAGQGAQIPHKIKMNQVITGVPFGDGEVKLHMDTSSGEVVLDKGHMDDAEVTVTTDYETAKAIFVEQNPQAGMQAFMQGKIKVQGDMTKLMALQAGVPDETAKKIADEIKAATT